MEVIIARPPFLLCLQVNASLPSSRPYKIPRIPHNKHTNFLPRNIIFSHTHHRPVQPSALIHDDSSGLGNISARPATLRTVRDRTSTLRHQHCGLEHGVNRDRKVGSTDQAAGVSSFSERWAGDVTESGKAVDYGCRVDCLGVTIARINFCNLYSGAQRNGGRYLRQNTGRPIRRTKDITWVVCSGCIAAGVLHQIKESLHYIFRRESSGGIGDD